MTFVRKPSMAKLAQPPLPQPVLPKKAKGRLRNLNPQVRTGSVVAAREYGLQATGR